ncbi:hypothetical protein [Roseovarius aestuarii]|uniref:Uncharacterized protein n=1 Tax=Roseovarius aestuarii TaxID=475083 RepID=A0A1X7BWN6_9RHOB|nr:hypothetical protein [Roseovarius aestuarii]SMC14051.1 hypothetical protein ROA7745_03915 [Roseovarius aestuarii]
MTQTSKTFVSIGDLNEQLTKRKMLAKLIGSTDRQRCISYSSLTVEIAHRLVEQFDLLLQFVEDMKLILTRLGG